MEEEAGQEGDLFPVSTIILATAWDRQKEILCSCWGQNFIPSIFHWLSLKAMGKHLCPFGLSQTVARVTVKPQSILAGYGFIITRLISNSKGWWWDKKHPSREGNTGLEDLFVELELREHQPTWNFHSNFNNQSTPTLHQYYTRVYYRVNPVIISYKIHNHHFKQKLHLFILSFFLTQITWRLDCNVEEEGSLKTDTGKAQIWCCMYVFLY